MKFSLIMPAYNSEKTIAESIDTLIAQTYPGWELIVVNDGSTDSTLDIVNKYSAEDGRIRVFSQENSGTAVANNFGISQANGDFITVFPSDDWLMPDYLQEFKNHIELAPGYDIYFANGWLKFEDGSEVKIITEDLFDREPTFAQIIKTCPCSLGAMVKKGVHDSVGWYRKERYTEDYDFWLRAADKHKRLYFFDKALVKVRLSATQKSANKIAICESDLAIMRELLASEGRSAKEVAALKNRISYIELLKSGKLEKKAEIQKDTGRQLDISAQKFYASVERIVGSKNAPKVLKVLHWVTFLVRPLRIIFYRLKAMQKNR